MLHTSLVPTIVGGGFRYNVIPSEAKATIDVRLHPDEDQSAFLDQVRKVINDPRVEVRWGRERYRPAGGSKIDTEAYAVLEAQTKKHYDTIVLPTMGTGATDMSNIRAKGIQCYGIGPALDTEDPPKGFGAHSDQERILESELHRFVRFQYDVVVELAQVAIVALNTGWTYREQVGSEGAGLTRPRLSRRHRVSLDQRRVGATTGSRRSGSGWQRVRPHRHPAARRNHRVASSALGRGRSPHQLHHPS